MALQMTVTWKDIVLTDAYHKIMRVSGGKDMGLEVIMGVHASSTGDMIYSSYEHVPSTALTHGATEGDYLAQAYAHLKARTPGDNQVDYSAATDV